MTMRADSALAVTTLVLGTLCLALQISSLISPNWGSFSRHTHDTVDTLIDEGHFGPWKVCLNDQWVSNAKRTTYETLCEPGITEYIPPRLTTSAGILAVVNAVLLCQYIPLAVIHIIKILKRDKELILKTKTVIVFKIILTVIIAALSVGVLGFFAGSRSPTNKFVTDYEWGFYVIVVTVVLSFGLTGVTEAEYFIHKRLHAKEKRNVDPTGIKAETYGNPGFGTPRKTNGNNYSTQAAKSRRLEHTSSQSSATNTLSSINPNTDSSFLETSFNGIMDSNTLRKVDPSMDTGMSYPNPHFMSSSSPSSHKKGIRKNTQV